MGFRRFLARRFRKDFKEIENTLLKAHIRKRLLLEDGEEASITSLKREKATMVTADLYQTDKIKTDPSENKFLACTLEVKTD